MTRTSGFEVCSWIYWRKNPVGVDDDHFQRGLHIKDL